MMENTFVIMYSSSFPNNAKILSAMHQQEDWKIDMQDAWLVLWWCRQLGLTKSQLEYAVSVAGPLIEDIRNFVGSQKSLDNPPTPVAAPAAANHVTNHSTLNRSPF